MNYKPYNKQAVIAAMNYRNNIERLYGDEKVSFWDISKWPERWQKGAEQLEKTAPGRIITAPVRLPESVLTATRKTVEQVPGIVKTVTKTLPLILVTGAVVGGGFYLYKSGILKKLAKGKK